MSSNEFGSERSKPWNIYTTSDPSPSQAVVDQEAPWKNFGASMNAISFGFVATAILISMFLIMAIFEHLFRPPTSFSSPDVMNNVSSDSGPKTNLSNAQTYPTYIAQPAPLGPLPCQREGIYRPSYHHEHNFVHP
ncbi:hypothetical protein Patl1_36725 [Pistacia atlantica]|nr:hypothetical protein Patl1_36725 [Pistacia atlantica]